jgi:hypothetical protein
MALPQTEQEPCAILPLFLFFLFFVLFPFPFFFFAHSSFPPYLAYMAWLKSFLINLLEMIKRF